MVAILSSFFFTLIPYACFSLPILFLCKQMQANASQFYPYISTYFYDCLSFCLSYYNTLIFKSYPQLTVAIRCNMIYTTYMIRIILVAMLSLSIIFNALYGCEPVEPQQGNKQISCK